jgi:hypothetical protein
MATLSYRAVCYTCNCFIGSSTTDHQQAFQDEQSHTQLPGHDQDDVDIQVTQSFSMAGNDPDWSGIDENE